MTVTVTIATLVLLVYFTRDKREHRVPPKEWIRTFFANRYYIHALIFPIMAALKLFVDRFNDPLKGLRGNYTHLVHAVEGKLVLYIQSVFENPILTAVLNFHYLFIYALLFVLTPVYFMYVKEREMADKAMMNYVVIYVLAIPYYLFFNVDVTSTFLPGMKALLYHHSALYFDFFATSDPLDNAFPSLHTAIPAGLIFIQFLHCRQRGIRLRDWAHRPLHRFIVANAFVFMFSILYLGIHWIIDIAAGILLALIGALAVHAIHPYLRPADHQYRPHRIQGFRVGRAIALAFGVLIAIPLLSATADDTVETPTMQLGPGDVKADVIGPVPEDGPIQVQLAHLAGPAGVEVLMVPLDEVPNLAEEGRINWTALSAGRDIGLLPPNSTLELRAMEAGSLHVVIVHDPRPIPGNGTVEDLENVPPSVVQLRSVYPDPQFWESLLMSLPSFAITGTVMHRQWQLWRARLPWTTDRRLE